MDAARRARRRTIAYTGASVALLAVMALQVMWFMPDEVQRRYPQARPWLEQFCAFSGCRLREARVAPFVAVFRAAAGPRRSQYGDAETLGYLLAEVFF